MVRKLLIVSAIFGALIAGACGKELAIKIYQSNFTKGGLFRAQDNELVKYQDSNGFFCVSENDMRKLVEVYKACEELQDK